MQGPSIHASIREVRRREHIHRGVECVTGPHRSRTAAGDDGVGDRRHKRQQALDHQYHTR